VTIILACPLVKKFVIAKAFYPLLLIVANEFGVHFHLSEMSETLGRIIFCLAVSSSTLYGVASSLVLTITSVLSTRDVHRFSPMIIRKVAFVDGTLGTTNYRYLAFWKQNASRNAINRSQEGFHFCYRKGFLSFASGSCLA